jgi:hypothetical protein
MDDERVGIESSKKRLTVCKKVYFNIEDGLKDDKDIVLKINSMNSENSLFMITVDLKDCSVKPLNISKNADFREKAWEEFVFIGFDSEKIILQSGGNNKMFKCLFPVEKAMMSFKFCIYFEREIDPVCKEICEMIKDSINWFRVYVFDKLI